MVDALGVKRIKTPFGTAYRGAQCTAAQQSFVVQSKSNRQHCHAVVTGRTADSTARTHEVFPASKPNARKDGYEDSTDRRGDLCIRVRSGRRPRAIQCRDHL
ncbi:hypothetical protein PSAC2689_60360 [Paraburkholderia sacchari]